MQGMGNNARCELVSKMSSEYHSDKEYGCQPRADAAVGTPPDKPMEFQGFLRSPWRTWVLFLMGWAALALLFAPETYVYFLFGGRSIDWRETLSLTVVNAAVALIFLPLIVWLTRTYPIERKTWPRAMLIHLPACLLFSISHSCLYWLACYASHSVGRTLFFRFQPNLLTYWAIVGFTQALDYFQRYTERERQLARAQLLLLKSQLHPHFLFNTLHTVSAMMHEDVAAADHMVNRLSELLRITLDNIGVHEVPLRHELDFVKKYVEIEQVRYSDAFHLETNIDPSTLDALVPSMVLQPLVENSIRHGFDLKGNRGRIEIAAQKQGSMLLLCVADNGRGVTGGVLTRKGLGIGNTEQRLRQLYGDQQSFQIDAAQGFKIAMSLPFRLATEPAEIMVKGVYESDSRAGRGRRELGPEADYLPSQV